MGNERILKIVEGHELGIYASGEIADESSFMYPAYKQAKAALSEIVDQTRRFHAATQNVTEDEFTNHLFQYGSNIIAFEAQRGGGKTRTMLSFSGILSKEYTINAPKTAVGENEDKSLKDLSFFTISPISPSALEEKQNILYVVLSRLYNYAEALLRPGKIGSRITEGDRIELSRLLHKCLSGINGIKRSDGRALEDISVLQDISDGISLRRHFFELIQCIIRIANPGMGKNNSFLILQLDDADSQIRNGYEVLEDVRKYLVIPNLVILTSVDLDFLHKVVLQDHLRHFKGLQDVLKQGFFAQELSRMCRKYIDKLIPPSHMIHLPQIDDCIERDPSGIQLKYVEQDSEKSVFEWQEGSGWNIQNMLLMLIYRKTGVLFVAPSHYLHNIIPRTLRGLNQLVYLLKNMDDIPEIKETNLSYPDALAKNILKTDWSNPASLAENILKQVEKAEENLTSFMNYFVHDWLGVKIRNLEDSIFLKEFSQTANSNRIRLAVQHLRQRFKDKIGNETEWEENTRVYLDTLMAELEKNNRKQEDFLLFFSIHTILSLESHRMILSKKRKTAQGYLEKHKDDLSSNHFLAFDFDPDMIYVPQTYIIKLDPNKSKIGTFNVDLFVMREYEPDEEPATLQGITASDFIRQCMSVNDAKNDSHISFINFITLLLRLGNEVAYPRYNSDKSQLDQADMLTTQRCIYKMQESALLIAANWDVQARIYRYFGETIAQVVIEKAPPKIGEPSTGECLEMLYKAIDRIIAEINGEKFLNYLSNQEKAKSQKLWIEDAFDNFRNPKRLAGIFPTVDRDLYFDELFDVVTCNPGSQSSDSSEEQSDDSVERELMDEEYSQSQSVESHESPNQ